MKVTKKELIKYLRNKLSKDRKWALKALLVIYNNQDYEEKQTKQTINHNGLGFDKFHSNILSSFAKRIINKKYLTSKQMKVLYNTISKYSLQIYNCSDKNKLTKLYLNDNIQLKLNI
jgi:hypothetical protein